MLSYAYLPFISLHPHAVAAASTHMNGQQSGHQGAVVVGRSLWTRCCLAVLDVSEQQC